jgi:hypothetical protein
MSIRASFLAMSMLAGWGALAPVAKASGTAKSYQVSSILSDAKMQAFQLREDAERLEEFTRGNASWASHVDAVNRIKVDVNAMAHLLRKIEDSRAGAEPWQQTAIDRVMPLAQEMASNTTAAIEYLNRRPALLNTADYRNYVEAITDSTGNLAATITDFTTYGKTKERLDRLTTKVEVLAGQ